jgi:excisionase family DNA binding protein
LIAERGAVRSTGLREETYLPETAGRVAKIYDFLRAHEQAGRQPPEPRYFLAGATADDRVEVPAEVYRMLRHVVEALRQGLAVTIAPQTTTLTTQQAAELLGVSRPTVIKLLDKGDVPFERVGTHRRILLRDLLAYRERRRAEQYAALAATAVDLEDEEDLETALQQLREVRHAVARRRKERAES